MLLRLFLRTLFRGLAALGSNSTSFPSHPARQRSFLIATHKRFPLNFVHELSRRQKSATLSCGIWFAIRLLS